MPSSGEMKVLEKKAQKEIKKEMDESDVSKNVRRCKKKEVMAAE